MLTSSGLSNMTFGKFAEIYLSDQLHYEPRTRDATATVLNVHLLPYWGTRKLRSITRRDVQEWVKHVAGQTYARGDRTQTYSATTVRDIYKHFRKIIRAAADEGYVLANPCKRIQLPKPEKHEQRFLAAAEVEALVEAMDDRYRVMVYVSAYLGLRWEEVSALKPSDLDLEGPVESFTFAARCPAPTARSRFAPTERATRPGGR